MFIIIFFLFIPLFSIEKRVIPQPMKTSMIIPCHVDHFSLLENLLLSIQNQTVPPDEVVISLSEYQNVAPLLLTALENKPWPFSLKILKHKAKYPPGRNRNEACSASTGDLLVCQDADDLPHPQRIEIIKYFFENFEINHLLHQWISTKEEFESYNLKDLEAKCFSFKYYFQIDHNTPIHNGSASFTRSVFDTVHWKPQTAIQEDVLFNQSVYVLCKNKAVLMVPLLLYRYELSTFDLNGDKQKK